MSGGFILRCEARGIESLGLGVDIGIIVQTTDGDGQSHAFRYAERRIGQVKVLGADAV